MKKIFSCLLCLMLFLAVLVNAGWMEERGFYSVVDEAYQVVTPLVKTSSNVLTKLFSTDDVKIEFSDDDYIRLHRAFFKDSEGNWYYFDYANLATDLNTMVPYGNIGEYQKLDTNWPNKLTLKVSVGMIRITDMSQPVLHRTLWSKFGQIWTGKYQTKLMTYSEYLANYYGKYCYLS